ncbi:MAG: CDP-alcohol phosphatidyltransferase family protein [Muribaculaceae bacterium]|nr:CDP-alcohol phosphatidyltransferase family protein [Muribaculaceae bacterium]
MTFKELKQEYKASLKSMDTEETIDLWFYRPMGFAWAKLFEKLGVTPNVVTIASIFLGVGGGILLYYGASPLLWLNYVGILLIIWANTYDSADGQLARLTKQYSRLGRILDGVSGDLWFVAIYFALVFRELHFGDRLLGDWFSTHNWAIWTLAILAGICHAKQAAMADYYRQFHLYFLKGKDGSELDSTSALDEQYAQLSWGKDFFAKVTMWFYRNYTRQQEGTTPRMQRLRAALKQRFGDENASDEFRADFRVKSLPLMKYTNMLSFNTRIIAMFISVIVQVPWLYFAFELIVLNAMMLYMIVRHESFCKTFTKALGDGKY